MSTGFASLNKAHRLIREFRKLHPELSCQVAETFLMIALDEGATVSSIGEKMGVSTAAASRHVSHLGKYDRRRNPGLGLVETRETLEDRRVKELRLTAKGRRVRDTLIDLMEG